MPGMDYRCQYCFSLQRVPEGEVIAWVARRNAKLGAAARWKGHRRRSRSGPLGNGDGGGSSRSGRRGGTLEPEERVLAPLTGPPVDVAHVDALLARLKGSDPGDRPIR